MQTGALLLSNCRYACHKPPETLYEIYNSTNNTAAIYGDKDIDLEENEDDLNGENDGNAEDGSSNGPLDEDQGGEERTDRRRRQLSLRDLEPPPHLCYKEFNGVKICQVYTEFSEQLNPNITLLQPTNPSAEYEEWCRYPVGKSEILTISEYFNV